MRCNFDTKSISVSVLVIILAYVDLRVMMLVTSKQILATILAGRCRSFSTYSIYLTKLTYQVLNTVVFFLTSGLSVYDGVCQFMPLPLIGAWLAIHWLSKLVIAY